MQTLLPGLLLWEAEAAMGCSPQHRLRLREVGRAEGFPGPRHLARAPGTSWPFRGPGSGWGEQGWGEGRRETWAESSGASGPPREGEPPAWGPWGGPGGFARSGRARKMRRDGGWRAEEKSTAARKAPSGKWENACWGDERNPWGGRGRAWLCSFLPRRGWRPSLTRGFCLPPELEASAPLTDGQTEAREQFVP